MSERCATGQCGHSCAFWRAAREAFEAMTLATNPITLDRTTAEWKRAWAEAATTCPKNKPRPA